MNDMIDTLDAAIERAPEPGAITDLAKRWACYCLTNHSGELLDKGLNIAKALVVYEDELYPDGKVQL